MSEISFITPLNRAAVEFKSSVGGAATGESFQQVLTDLVANANLKQHEKDLAVADFIDGQQADIHNTMIAIQKADVSFKYMTAVINRARRAYEEVRNMQI